MECSPLCDILWLKDGVPIQDNSDYFTVRSRQVFMMVMLFVMVFMMVMLFMMVSMMVMREMMMKKCCSNPRQLRLLHRHISSKIFHVAINVSMSIIISIVPIYLLHFQRTRCHRTTARMTLSQSSRSLFGNLKTGMGEDWIGCR